jgi:hypothetical protein
MDDARVLRRTGDNVVQFASFGVVAAAVLLIRHDVLSLVIGLPLAVLAVRTLRNGVYIGPRQVVVRNTFRSDTLKRADIERAVIVRTGPTKFPAVVIQRHDGSGVPVWCIQSTSRSRGIRSTRSKGGPTGLVATLQEVQRALGLLESQ